MRVMLDLGSLAAAITAVGMLVWSLVRGFKASIHVVVKQELHGVERQLEQVNNRLERIEGNQSHATT
jgi:uncharacterized membrane protein YciS (DUF1049 family)